MKCKQRGFTLIEIVVGIVVLAVALTIVTGVFLPQASKMTSPMYQIKATALGKSIMNQVLIRYYDDVNISSGSFSPCTNTTCTVSFGVESEDPDEPDTFNDVDDYQVYCSTDPQTTLNRFTDEYPGYGINICVTNAANKFVPLTPENTNNNVAKRIELTVFMPNNETITLTSFKGNY
ncbi:prepilin-type N-terminal cleavage/methylation domain-containing protein [Moritella marina ATCC 15381]|uniref:Prepilin-type N-terminal cleavage/methylation domain-containing protein n=1 Tax=Moritella marina ATCC 15381 TaxID=1202962 RepID=A0A5J6WQW6_MORMI|nr:prepilin-type N-terminal cleavage/methylation domain-containing protein [Moritella marina]QFI39741.1 prepilin-type N-terminal cleavage/methylation domain-containing protein [Moritella marina ATCC 15381]